MAEESDGIEEALEGQVRVLVTAASQLGELVARAREDALRRAQSASEQEARELTSRLAAEQRTARTELAGVYRSDWWDRATPEQIGHTWQVARAWSGEDPEAVRAEARMRDELRARYGVDVENTNADPAAVRAAVQRADPSRAAPATQVPGAAQGEELEQAKAWFAARDPERLARWQQQHNYADTVTGMRGDERSLVESELGRADHDRTQGDDEQTRAAADRAEAQLLMRQADRDDARAHQARAAVEHEPDPDERVRAAAAAEQHETTAGRAREDGRTLYDSAERRETTASDLEATGIDHQVVATRMRADVSQAKPATEAVKTGAGVTSPKARKLRGRAPRAQRTGLDR